MNPATSLQPAIVNCTPHDVHVYDEKGQNIIATYPRSGQVPRLAQQPQRQIGSITTESGTSVAVYNQQQFGDVEGLPPCPNGNSPDIIVSMLVGQKLQETRAWSGRVLGPDTGIGAVRAENGQIVGTKWLVEYCARRSLNQ